jgi:hypothetical protein
MNMKMKTMLLVIGFSVFVGQGLRAQTTPNFSGRWVQVTPSAEAEGGGSERTVTQDAATLTTEHPSEGGGHRQVYKLDGESRSTLGRVEVVSKTVWDGARLVITSTATYPGDNKRESRQVWSLGTDGRLTIELLAKNPDGTTTEIRSVHQKK